MNLFDLTITQLKRAAEIKQQIEDLNNELRSILGGSTKPGPESKKPRKDERRCEKENCRCSKGTMGKA